jgi:hypothetical protein
MDKAYPTKTTMVVRALEMDTDPFRMKGGEVLGPEYPYLSAIRELMYLTNNTGPDVAFVINCLARHSVALTMRHWNRIKNII